MESNGKYFDGKSSRAIPAFIYTNDLGLHLITLDQDNFEIEKQSFAWNELRMYEYISNGRSTVKAGTFPYQVIEINDISVQENLENWFNRHRIPMRLENFIRRNGIKGVLAGLGVLAGIILLWYFILIPVITYHALQITPRSVDKKIGATYYSSLVEVNSINIEASKAIQAYYNQLGYSKDDTLKVVVVHDDIMNAFALPGGYIVVYDKLLKKLKTHEELAALLAHESVHVLHRHTMQLLFNNLSSNILAAVLTSNSTGISSVAVNNAGSLLNLKYSRGKETEADTVGQRMMCEAGISNSGMIDLFEDLQKESKINIPEFLTNHPGLDKRIIYLKKLPVCKSDPSKQEKYTQLFNDLKDVLKNGNGIRYQ